jgi:hypothetical protein
MYQIQVCIKFKRSTAPSDHNAYYTLKQLKTEAVKGQTSANYIYAEAKAKHANHIFYAETNVYSGKIKTTSYCCNPSSFSSELNL